MTLTTPGALANVCLHLIERAPAWYWRAPFISGVDCLSVYDSNGLVPQVRAVDKLSLAWHGGLARTL